MYANNLFLISQITSSIIEKNTDTCDKCTSWCRSWPETIFTGSHEIPAIMYIVVVACIQDTFSIIIDGFDRRLGGLMNAYIGIVAYTYRC